MKRIGIYEGNRGSMFFYVVPHDRARHSERHVDPGFSVDETTIELYLAKFLSRHLDLALRMNRNAEEGSSFYSVKSYRNLLEDIRNETGFLKKAYRNIAGHGLGRADCEELAKFDEKEECGENEISSYVECLERVIEFYDRFILISNRMLSRDEKAPFILIRRNQSGLCTMAKAAV